jgi:5-methyltetrahydrofolate--homocysteine methyltransferase
MEPNEASTGTRFEARLAQPGVLVADGATGTMLQNAGLPRGASPERWNLENPEAVRNLHRSYIDAGADIVLTNTFGGNRYRMEREGLQDQVQEVNRMAARLAHQVAGDTVLVFGDVGPTGKLLRPFGPLEYAEAANAFADQVAGLVIGGVDAILVETMGDLNEARAAVEGTRRITRLPILVTMSFDTRGRTMMGVDPEIAARELDKLGLAALGANCGRTLDETLEAIRKMRKALPQAVLMAKPNAGLPRREEGTAKPEVVYDVTPEVMAEYALKFVEAGVKIFGGCCGSTPEHIRLVAQALKKR